MGDSPLELIIVPSPGTLPLRVPLVKLWTTIGSEQRADVRLAAVAPRWAIVRRSPGTIELTHLSTGAVHTLGRGERVTLDGVEIGVDVKLAAAGDDDAAPGLAVEPIAAALADVESPADALDRLLAELVRATGADRGAILLSERGAHRVAAAQDAAGRSIAEAADLLSDTLVRDALDSGRELRVDDAAQHPRYRNVPSVVALGLQSIACVPMRVERHLFGLVVLGRRDPRRPFGARELDGLRVVAAMAVPWLVRLRRAEVPGPADALVGESAGMNELRRILERVGPSELAVLVLGETGTGKELVARAVHAASGRRAGPLVCVNCSAVPESLMAAELFGVKKGAFTGATADRAGLVEHARSGTLFLDEVGDMPAAMQAALLRAVEHREVVRVGDVAARPVDFRVVAATHKDLDAEVAAGRFREDLLFRLREMTVRVPPLRDRGEDVVLLARWFLRRIEAEVGLSTLTLAPGAVDRLRAHPWPGNVRELRGAIRRSALLADGTTLRAEDILLDPPGRGARSGASDVVPGVLGALDRTLDDARAAFVTAYVRAVLERHGGNREAAAAALGISLRSLFRHLHE